MLLHNGKIETVEPAYTEQGSRKEICTVCPTELSSEPPDPLGHDYDANVWKSDDSSHWHECTRCGAEGDKESHTENEGVTTTPPTSYSNGVKTYHALPAAKLFVPKLSMQ